MNRSVWEAKDRSDVVYTQRLLKSGTKNEKLIALQGLNSWYDPVFRQGLTKLARRSGKEIKIAALNAIGQSKDSFYVSFLLKTVRKTKSKEVQATALVALGKCITKSGQERLLQLPYLASDGYSQCMYRALLNGVKVPGLTDRMAGLLFSESRDNRFYAAWYLARTPQVLNAANYQTVIKALMGLDNKGLRSDLSIPLLISLGKAKVSSSDSLTIRKTLFHFLPVTEKHWSADQQLEAVAAMRALISGSYTVADSQFQFVQNPAFAENPSLQMMLSELIRKNCVMPNHVPEAWYPPAAVHLLRSETCRLDAVYAAENAIFEQIWKVQAMEKHYERYPSIKNILLQAESPAVKTAAMESLIRCSKQKGFPGSLTSDLHQTLKVLIRDGDAGVLSVIANSILEGQVQITDSAEKTEFTGLIQQAKNGLNLPREMEALIDLEKVLAELTHTRFIKPVAEWNHPIDWSYVGSVPSGQRVKVQTTKGTFTIQLQVNEAPASVGAILKLVDQGFYNGKYFHRLVPDFVIQGGCPRGDGYGGPDYTLRSEFSGQSYRSGTVGLASAGPDTEGCQWFVTHCPTPHLDGRYTIIGFVAEGMEVVHRLGVGDRMIQVSRE